MEESNNSIPEYLYKSEIKRERTVFFIAFIFAFFGALTGSALGAVLTNVFFVDSSLQNVLNVQYPISKTTITQTATNQGTVNYIGNDGKIIYTYTLPTDELDDLAEMIANELNKRSQKEGE